MSSSTALRTDRGPAHRGIVDLFSSRTVLLILAGLFYAGRLTHGRLDPFGADWLGLVFNSMLDHLLQGRWDVDPAAIGNEAFVHDGRSFAYFGPFPAFLRLPLAVLAPDWRSLHVERVSCWLAILVGIAAQCRAVGWSLAATAPPLRQQLAAPLLLACALSGAPMLLGWKGAAIYHEAILWAWALAMWFVALALPALSEPGPIGWRRLCGLSLCAGLCLLTRSTTGAGLVLLAAVLIGWEVVRAHRAVSAPSQRWRVWAPMGVLGALICAVALVNKGRWGNPLMFADMHSQVELLEAFPDRLARLARHGLFDWHRLGTGLLYYVAPVWTAGLDHAMPLHDRLFDYYDAVERPASSLLLTDPAWCFLSGIGIAALVRRRVASRNTLLVAALSLAPAAMLVAWYMAFRYRAEFGPLLLALSCIGLRHRWAPCAVGQGRRGVLVVAALCALQVGVSAFAGRSYALQSFGPTEGYDGLSLHCALAWNCPDPQLPDGL